MDIMIPYLGQISRLQMESKGAFHIAGLKDANTSRIEREKRQKRELERNLKAAKKQQTREPTEKKSGDEDEIHLDTWA